MHIFYTKKNRKHECFLTFHKVQIVAVQLLFLRSIKTWIRYQIKKKIAKLLFYEPYKDELSNDFG